VAEEAVALVVEQPVMAQAQAPAVIEVPEADVPATQVTQTTTARAQQEEEEQVQEEAAAERAVQTEEAIASFFARTEAAPLTVQGWLEEWLPAGGRTSSSESRQTESAPSQEAPPPAESAPPSDAPTQQPSEDEIARMYDAIDAWFAENSGFDPEMAFGAAPAPLLAIPMMGMALEGLRFGATPGMAPLASLPAGGLQGIREGLLTLG
jgi:hypothetical protein